MIGLIVDLKSHPKLNIVKCDTNILFIVLDDDQFKKLDKTSEGQDRIDMFNSDDFIKKVIYSCCFEFSEHVLNISKCDKRYIKLLLDTVYKTFEDNITIIASINPELTSFGFNNPKICNNNQNNSDSDVCVSKSNKFISKAEIKPNSIKIDLAFLNKQRTLKHCQILLEIEQESREFLKHLTTAGVTKTNDGKRSQKEIFGSFKISNEKHNNNNKIIYSLSVDKSSLVSGKEEEIEAFGSLYNFHTHPKEAYDRHKVKYGVPSVSDYCAVYQLSKQGTIIHFVATLEGLYGISLNPTHDILKRNASDVLKYIEKHFGYSRNNLEKYLTHINKLDLFKVELIPYNKTVQIQAVFNKHGSFNNCVIRE